MKHFSLFFILATCFAVDCPEDRSCVITEQRNAQTTHMHEMQPKHVAALLIKTSSVAPAAASQALPEISGFLEELIPRFHAGGRLIMIGSGTSGRLAVIEAAEMLPTFQLPRGRIVGVIAGGARCLVDSSAGLEDSPEGAYGELRALNLTDQDTVLGITAGGSTPYVHGGLAFAKERGCVTGLLSCAQTSGADHVIILPTGPEPLTGSTRMNAGTATKIVLNSITTALMVAEGRVYENLMVDVDASNLKLKDRAARIVSTLSSCSREEAFRRLEEAGGSLRKVVSFESMPKPVVATDPSPLQEFLKRGFERYICIDGGGTKTLLQVLDSNGKPMGQMQTAGPLNIHDVGEPAVRATLNALLAGIDPKGAAIVAGVAGAEGRHENECISQIFRDHGFEHLWVRGDGELLVDVIQPTGVVLIAGTGSHCMGFHNGKKARCGGLGRVLGDEGSGYFIGLEAIKAALEANYGWGPKTNLTDQIVKHFNVADIEELIAPITSGSLGKREIARLAPVVIGSSDPVARRIVDDAVDHLANMVRQTLIQLDLGTSSVHLVGGLFRSETIVAKLEALVPITPVNLAGKHPVAWGINSILEADIY